MFGNFAMAYGVLLPWYGWTAPAALHYAVFTIISLLAMLSHFSAMTTNPGAVPLNCPVPPQAVCAAATPSAASVALIARVARVAFGAAVLRTRLPLHPVI